MNKTKTRSILTIVLALFMALSCLAVLTACAENKETIKTTEVSSFNELQTALTGDCDEIKIMQDIDITKTIVITRKVSINLNGKTLSNSNDLWNDTDQEKAWSIISVRKEGNLTINGNGKLDAKENDCYAVDVMDGGKLVIENGEFVGNISAVYVFEGTAEIKGGKYSIKQLNSNGVETAHGSTINIYNQNGDNGTAKVEISGGEFVNFDPAGRVDNKHDKLVKDGYTAELIDGTTNYKVVKIAE